MTGDNTTATDACRQAGGIGNTAFAEANAAGRITWISLPSTWVNKERIQKTVDTEEGIQTEQEQ